MDPVAIGAVLLAIVSGAAEGAGSRTAGSASARIWIAVEGTFSLIKA
jgi:hypothetical protein